MGGSKNDSRIKKGKKQKLVIAKDKKQLYTAIAVVAIFLINSVYMIVKYVQEQNPAPIRSDVTQQQGIDPEAGGDIAGTPANNQPTPANMAPDGAPAPAPGASTAANSDLSAPADQNLSDQSMQQPLLGNEQKMAPIQDANNIYAKAVNIKEKLANKALMSVNPNNSDVEIISAKKAPKKNIKMVDISVDNAGSTDPFVPFGEIKTSTGHVASLPSYLTAPPSNLSTDSDAGKVMSTTISGILYDKYNPSAIINIEGTDYLVKKGDIINSYKVLSIGRTQVVVQLGKNIYQAGVGELLSQTDLNYNTIANLNNKFGGNDVSISVKKKIIKKKTTKSKQAKQAKRGK